MRVVVSHSKVSQAARTSPFLSVKGILWQPMGKCSFTEPLLLTDMKTDIDYHKTKKLKNCQQIFLLTLIAV